MSLPDFRDPATVSTAALAAAAGRFVGSFLVERGLRQLEASVSDRTVRVLSSIAGGVAGVAAVLAARHAGTWWLLPAALAWADIRAGLLHGPKRWSSLSAAAAQTS